MPFFVDSAPVCGETYVYTIVAYDLKGMYSYPIESIIKVDCDVEFQGQIQYCVAGVQPFVQVVERYEDDLALCKLLKEYYLRQGNNEKAESIAALISRLETTQSEQ
jgi:hypothetical protein